MGTIRVEDAPASRALDALVAEKVMGQAPCSFWAPAAHPLMGLMCNSEHVAEHNCYPAQQGPPRYSENIAAAWTVVERMGIHVFNNTHWRGWHATFLMCDDMGCDERCATAPTAPLAICRAALLAVGVTEVPE